LKIAKRKFVRTFFGVFQEWILNNALPLLI
jgi:hypothetical protein